MGEERDGRRPTHAVDVLAGQCVICAANDSRITLAAAQKRRSSIRALFAGFCIHLEKRRTLSTALEHLARKDRQIYTNRKKLLRTCHALMWKMISDPLEKFLLPHGCRAQDLAFQCDADCRSFARDQGWQLENRGPAYVLADILAWGNGHGQEPAGTIRLDIADSLERQTLKRFK